MRIVRRRVLNLSGVIFLLTLLMQTVMLITGLRSYASRAEVPLHLLEMGAVVLMAFYTYYYSRRFSFLLMTLACAALLAPLIQKLPSEPEAAGSSPLPTEIRIVFDVLLGAGYVLMILLSILVCPMIRRSNRNAVVIRILAAAVIALFAARFVYHIALLVITLNAETYPGEYETKYYYVQMAADLALAFTGFGGFLTSRFDPSIPRPNPQDEAETEDKTKSN